MPGDKEVITGVLQDPTSPADLAVIWPTNPPPSPTTPGLVPLCSPASTPGQGLTFSPRQQTVQLQMSRTSSSCLSLAGEQHSAVTNGPM